MICFLLLLNNLECPIEALCLYVVLVVWKERNNCNRTEIASLFLLRLLELDGWMNEWMNEWMLEMLE